MKPGTLLGGGLAVVIAAGLTSCAQVPDHGAVVEARSNVQFEEAQAPFSRPRPPQPGEAPDDIVNGFLEAMQATPVQVKSARQYLTKQAQLAWQPDRVYSYTSVDIGATSHHEMVVRLRGTEQIGSRGQWLGPLSPAASRLTFPMQRQDGEWRIARAPSALVVPQTFYDQNFQDASLYFFDPSGRILVPEPVHVPQGAQLASALVRGLLRGPQPSLGSAVSRTFIPPGLEAQPVAVDRGVATVSLKGTDPGPLSQPVVQQILAQLAWTLRQDPSITAFTLTIANEPVSDASGDSRYPVDGAQFSRFDPAYWRASSQVYALRKGRLVSGPVNRLTKVEGPFGQADLGIHSFAVSLDGYRVAAVISDRLEVGAVLGQTQPTAVLDGSGLLRPAWDFAKRLWEIQNGSRGARVSYFIDGNRHGIRIPGITGTQVRRFLVSWDGSRIVAVVRGPERDHLVASRLRYDANGRPVGATRGRPISWGAQDVTRIRDIGWTSPTTIAVLDRVSPAQSEVRILNVDGSTRPDQVSPTQITGRVSRLVTSPSETPYALVAQSGLLNISPTETNRPLAVDGFHQLAYAG